MRSGELIVNFLSPGYSHLVSRYHQTVLATCPCPWDEDDRLIEPVFRTSIRTAISWGIADLYIFGTAGEGHAVDNERFRTVVDCFAEETLIEGVRPMVGVIGLSTPNVVDRLEFAYERGFRTFQISLPSWGAISDREMLRFFGDVCGSFPDAEFMHYNVLRAGRTLTGGDYRRVLEVAPNLVATKNTFGDIAHVSELMKVTELQHFLGERTFAIGSMYGECSLLAAYAWLQPKRALELFNAGSTGDIATAMRLAKEYHELGTRLLGWLRTEPRMDGFFDKLLVRLGGVDDFPLRLLSPSIGASEAEFEKCRQILVSEFGDWLT